MRSFGSNLSCYYTRRRDDEYGLCAPHSCRGRRERITAKKPHHNSLGDAHLERLQSGFFFPQVACRIPQYPARTVDQNAYA